MLKLLQENDPFVAFVGAGASKLAPSNLPTWTEFNNLLLECLCDRLAVYSSKRQPTDEMLSAFRARRDKSRFFAPDFQAQLIEEEVGADYFRVWQSLETDVFGPVHAGLAELAERGRIAAIITTNFDRLIEIALQKRGIAFEVFHIQVTFESLEEKVKGASGVLPVIKIHGSIEDATSLVDTLKQRVVGRPESLGKVIQILLRKYAWLYLGFSGADFNYDPHYLGILDAAAEAKGFVFVAREGKNVLEGVRHLAEAYGPNKADIVHGDLATWLSTSFALPAPSSLSTPDGGSDDDAVRRVREGIWQWADGLGPMAVVNILCSMLKSAGMEHQAFWLLRKTWKSYRGADDQQSKSYGRYNYNYGMSLLETGFIRNPIPLADDMSNVIEWREHANQNAYEFFGRSYESGKLLSAGGQLACVLAYRGEVGKAMSLASMITDQALARNARLELCDVAIASVVIYDIVQMFGPPSVQLRRCLTIAKELGDEPRRAMLCTHLGRLLTYGGKFAEADQFIEEAERIGCRLDLRPVLLASRAARGLWLADSRTSAEKAVQTLREVAGTIHSQDAIPLVTKFDLAQSEPTPILIKGRNPTLCRVLLDLNRAAMLAGDADMINQTLDQLDELTTDVFLGYCPHYYLSYAQCLIALGDGEEHRKLAADLIGRARQVGELSQNPWVGPAANHLERQIGSGHHGG